MTVVVKPHDGGGMVGTMKRIVSHTFDNFLRLERGEPLPEADRINRLSKELKAVLALDELKKKLLNDGAEVDYIDPTEFGPFLERPDDHLGTHRKDGQYKGGVVEAS